jgi:hypothetical protein
MQNALTNETSTVWFRRILVYAETLMCEDALTSDNPSDYAERQAKFLNSVNFPDEESYLLDSHPTAKQLWEKLRADYARWSFIRTAELIQCITHERPPKNETLSTFLQRTMQLRAACRSAGVDDDVLLSACYLLTLRNTEQFHDWAIQHLQHDPPHKVPDLLSNLRTTFTNLMTEPISVQPPA